MHRMDLRGTSFLRQVDGMLHGRVRPRSLEVSRHGGGFAQVEHSLVNGLLPDPSPDAARSGWMDTYHWDFAVYANSNPQISKTARFYSTHKAAINYSGLFSDLPRGLKGVSAIKRQRTADLFPVLERCGILRRIEGPYQNEQRNLEWKELLLVPTWPATSSMPIVSVAPKTKHNLEQHHRTWFMMPSALFNDRKRTWRAVGTHRDRRVLAALYCFYEARTYAAVNPNHLRLEAEVLCASDAFLKACGGDATLRDVASTLAVLLNMKRVFPLCARLEAGTPYPAGDEYVTWAEPVAHSMLRNTAVFVPLYVPTEKDLES